MNDFSIGEMLEMQKALQEKYKDKWTELSPETGKNQLLWMIGEKGRFTESPLPPFRQGGRIR